MCLRVRRCDGAFHAKGPLNPLDDPKVLKTHVYLEAESDPYRYVDSLPG
jgi:hypothetical protein